MVPCPPTIERISIRSVTFRSDHALLTDHEVDWEDGGVRFPKPEWSLTARHPVTHSMGEHITIEIELLVEPPDAAPEVGSLIGTGPRGLSFKKNGIRFAGGRFSIEMMSTLPIPRQVSELSFAVTWQVSGVSVPVTPQTTRNKVYVTIGPPTTPSNRPGITLRRMREAIRAAGKANRMDPHSIAGQVLSRWGAFNLDVALDNAWELADDRRNARGELVGADCQTIVRYTQKVLRMIGCPGLLEFVVVWAKVPTPAQGEQNPAYSPNVSDPPQWHNDHRPYDSARATWLAALVDHGGRHNSYEACLRVSHDGVTAYYAGGVGRLPDADAVIRVFASMSWRDDATLETKESIYVY